MTQTKIQKTLDLYKKLKYNSLTDGRSKMWCVLILWKGAMHMLLEQVYLFIIYILFIELAIVTIVAIALFVALNVAVRKIDNEKNTSLLNR